MNFCTAITCMDGRIQLPVIKFLQNYFDSEFVDTITEPGINKIIAQNSPIDINKSILKRLDISVNAHKSKGIAIIGHHDCAGNPTDNKTQNEQTIIATKEIKKKYPTINVIGLWVDESWTVNVIC